MARYQTGWLKLWRGAWEKDLGANLILWGLWHALLHLATWRETKILWEGKQRILPPGSVVFGIKEVASKWGCSRSVIKKWLHHLHDTDRIVLETCPRGCLVTISNWKEFQSTESEECPQRDYNVSIKSSQRNHSEPLNEEVKNKRSNIVQSAFDLESIYRQYPRKQGRAKGLQILAKEIVSDQDYQDLQLAVSHYKGCDHVEGRFVKLFSTFAAEWRDWVDPESGRSQLGNRINTKPISLEEIV